jgi:hypothetical protein
VLADLILLLGVLPCLITSCGVFFLVFDLILVILLLFSFYFALQVFGVSCLLGVFTWWFSWIWCFVRLLISNFGGWISGCNLLTGLLRLNGSFLSRAKRIFSDHVL